MSHYNAFQILMTCSVDKQGKINCPQKNLILRYTKRLDPGNLGHDIEERCKKVWMGSSSVVHIHSHSTMAKVAIYFNCLFHLTPFLPLWQFCHLNLTKLLQYLCLHAVIHAIVWKYRYYCCKDKKTSTIKYWFCFQYCPSIQLF